MGWGINLTSNLKLSKTNVAKLAFAYGHGIENYMNDAPVDVGVATNPPNSPVPLKGVALPVLGVVSFLDHTWSERFHQFGRIFAGEHPELRRATTVGFSPG